MLEPVEESQNLYFRANQTHFYGENPKIQHSRLIYIHVHHTCR